MMTTAAMETETTHGALSQLGKQGTHAFAR